LASPRYGAAETLYISVRSGIDKQDNNGGSDDVLYGKTSNAHRALAWLVISLSGVAGSGVA